MRYRVERLLVTEYQSYNVPKSLPSQEHIPSCHFPCQFPSQNVACLCSRHFFLFLSPLSFSLSSHFRYIVLQYCYWKGIIYIALPHLSTLFLSRCSVIISSYYCHSSSFSVIGLPLILCGKVPNMDQSFWPSFILPLGIIYKYHYAQSSAEMLTARLSIP